MPRFAAQNTQHGRKQGLPTQDILFLVRWQGAERRQRTYWCPEHGGACRLVCENGVQRYGASPHLWDDASSMSQEDTTKTRQWNSSLSMPFLYVPKIIKNILASRQVCERASPRTCLKATEWPSKKHRASPALRPRKLKWRERKKNKPFSLYYCLQVRSVRIYWFIRIFRV